jgi:hypothetical protein
METICFPKHRLAFIHWVMCLKIELFKVDYCWGLIAMDVCEVFSFGMNSLAASPLHPHDTADHQRYSNRY